MFLKAKAHPLWISHYLFTSFLLRISQTFARSLKNCYISGMNTKKSTQQFLYATMVSFSPLLFITFRVCKFTRFFVRKRLRFQGIESCAFVHFYVFSYVCFIRVCETREKSNRRPSSPRGKMIILLNLMNGLKLFVMALETVFQYFWRIIYFRNVVFDICDVDTCSQWWHLYAENNTWQMTTSSYSTDVHSRVKIFKGLFT